MQPVCDKGKVQTLDIVTLLEASQNAWGVGGVV